eukprot:3729406-Prymnesium_polylepis.9
MAASTRDGGLRRSERIGSQWASVGSTVVAVMVAMLVAAEGMREQVADRRGASRSQCSHGRRCSH